MNCPSCHSVMMNRDERHHVHPDSYRMNLHCLNRDCNRSHMGVIVPPSYANQEWICDHYNFHLKAKNSSFILRATPSTPIIKFINNKWELIWLKNQKTTHKVTQILKDFNSSPIIEVPFVPLSTNNDMHDHAMYVFHKYINLVAFL